MIWPAHGPRLSASHAPHVNLDAAGGLAAMKHLLLPRAVAAVENDEMPSLGGAADQIGDVTQIQTVRGRNAVVLRGDDGTGRVEETGHAASIARAHVQSRDSRSGNP